MAAGEIIQVSSFLSQSIHCVKSIQIRSFFRSLFLRIRTEFGEGKVSQYGVFSGPYFPNGIWTLFTQWSSWLHDQNLWKIIVEKFNFFNVADLYPATFIRTGHFHRHFLIRLALIKNSYFAEDLPVAAFKRKTYFVQYNDQRKMLNRPSEIAKY